jgi:hypothetical protein
MALAIGFMQEMAGVLGDVVIVHRGNKTFIKKRPKRSQKPLTEMALAKREKFGLGGKIASKIASIYEINKLWAPDPDKNLTGYNRMFQANHGKFNIVDLSGKIEMSDGGGLEVLNASIKIRDNGVQIYCDSFSSRDTIKREAAKKIIATGIIVLINPKEGENCPKYQIMTFKSEYFPIDNEGKFTAMYKYNGGDMEKFSWYQLKKAFGVFVTMDAELNPIDISKTIES